MSGIKTVLLAPLLAFVTMLRAMPESQLATSTGGMVVAASPEAAEAGAAILAQWGNAADAAVTVGFVLAVTYPRAGNIGGGGFMLLRDADGRAEAIDYRETAPAAARRDTYLNGGDKDSLVGHRASGVPGTVAGLALAWERHGSGRFTWAQLIEPARRLAAEGFVLSDTIAEHLAGSGGVMRGFPESERLYLNNGDNWKAGHRFVQTDLARTLGRIQDRGPREFYEGETSRLIVDEMARHGGLITADDLRGYRAVVRVPLKFSYRGRAILTMPPPSSGGIVLGQMLAMIEPFEVENMSDAARSHLLIEVMKRAFHDRAYYMADPDFYKVPVAQLLARDYLAKKMAGFDPDKATSSDAITGLAVGDAWPTVVSEPTETTHYSIVDAAGNVVSNTYTLNGNYGSGVTVTGGGFLMNNEMDDFATRPGMPNGFGLVQGEANAVQAGKRPLSSMTPTIVLQEGKPLLVVGSPGGPTIINTVFQVIVNVVDRGMPVGDAVAAPRLHHQWLPDRVVYEPGGMTEKLANELIRKGHSLGQSQVYWTDKDNDKARRIGDAAVIGVDPVTGVRTGAGDPRNAVATAAGADAVR